MTETFRGRTLVQGEATGEAVMSARAFTFAHGVEPSSGLVTDIRSDVRGANVRGKVLLYPHGKGSTTASSWFLETVREGNHPVAIVTSSVDLSAVIGSVMAKLLYGRTIPVVSGVSPGNSIKSGMRLSVGGEDATVTVLE
ncbi:MAG TPA: DUF126 domain-containing protein [Nitrososphaerales archaeon]|nr:DUF126 domain-containing protein [Nitrososphaerales archaeon]